MRLANLQEVSIFYRSTGIDITIAIENKLWHIGEGRDCVKVKKQVTIDKCYGGEGIVGAKALIGGAHSSEGATYRQRTIELEAPCQSGVGVAPVDCKHE